MTTPHYADNYQQALTYHRRLPDRIRTYLHSRGLPDAVICRFRLGWNGVRITIPITNRHRQVVLFRLAKDPADTSDSPNIMSSENDVLELYGWERLVFKKERIVICQGEFERLVLEARGIPAISSTGDGSVFRLEWADGLRDTERVYVCFRNDKQSQDNAAGVAALVPHSRIVLLPNEVGLGGGIEDYLVRLGKTTDEFRGLLDMAVGPEEAPTTPDGHD